MSYLCRLILAFNNSFYIFIPDCYDICQGYTKDICNMILVVTFKIILWERYLPDKIENRTF